MLGRKLLRDMGSHKTQFISIFLMAFLAIYVYAGIGGEWVGLQHSSDKFYRETNMADGFLYGNSFDDEMTEDIEDISSVSNIERRLSVPANLDAEGDPSVQLFFLEKNTISTPYIVDGKKIVLDDEDGVWLDKRFADARELEIGDEVTFEYGAVELELTIRGLVYSPEYVFRAENEGMVPDFAHNGFAFMSDEAFPIEEMLTYNNLLIESNENDPIKLENSIDKAIYGDYTLFLSKDEHASVKTFESEIQQHKMMGDIFPVVFLLIALLTILTTMTRIVTNQRTQIGTLKALGFKKGRITLHYVSFGFVLSLLGAALGVVAGPLTLPLLFYPSMSGFYTLPEWKPYFSMSFVWVAIALVLCCTLVTFLASRKMLKDLPAETLRPAAPKVKKQWKIETSRFWQKFSFNTRWNLRDVRRNKSRSLMAIVGVFGCTALLSCAFGMQDGMVDLKNWQYDDLIHYRTKIVMEDTATQKDAEKIAKDTNGETFMDGNVELKSDDTKKNGALTVFDNNELITFSDTEQKRINLPKDGLAITSKIAELLGVTEGDTIMWHIVGEEGWETSKIDFVYREPLSQGIAMSREYLEDKGYDYKSTSVLTKEKITKVPKNASSVNSKTDMENGWDELTESMMLMVYILILAAVVLAIVVLYNLGLLSFTEKERDIATLKVLGFKTGRLRNLLLTQNIWFAVIGYILGMPAGLWLVEVMVDSSGEAFDFPISMHGTNMLYSFLITFGLSIFTNLLFSGKVKKIDMVEALKSSE